MERIKLKICGLRDNIHAVAGLQPDYIGFIMFSRSPRYVGESFSMPHDLPEEIRKVGVYVNSSIESVLQTADKFDFNAIQLHGDETVQYCQELKRAYNGQIFKAIRVKDKIDLTELEQYASTVDFFLFDTQSSKYGGTGKRFNWKVLEDYNLDVPYFLSGGIDVESLDDLHRLDLSKLQALDINSRFEVSPGLKDIQMLKEFQRRFAEFNKANATVRF